MQSRHPSMEFLLHAASHTGESGERDLDEIIQKELGNVASTLPQWENQACLFQNMGDFITCTTALLSRLADRVVNGNKIDDYVDKKVKEMQDENEFSEIDDLVYLSETHRSLKLMVEALATTSNSIDSRWRATQKQYRPRSRTRHPSESEVSPKSESSSTPSREATPSPEERTLSFQQSPILPMPPALPSLLPAALEHVHNAVIPSPSTPGPTTATPPAHYRPVQTPRDLCQFPDHSSSPEAQVHEMLATLTQRGTGLYRCPHGLSCSKGGARDGKEVVFERNSAFRAHLQKHEKQFHCDLPGCTARGGFARIDQLRRHQSTVSHRI